MSEAGSGKDNEQKTADKKEDVQYKYRKKNLMKRIIITCILILTAGLCLAPVLFLLVGTFMGNHEIYTCIAPALGKGDGLAIWHLLPQYPTLQNVVELLFDSPEYFQMFWNSIFYTGAILAGQMLFGMPAAWGLARYSFRGRKTVYRLFILVMMMPFQVTMLSQYLVLNRLGMLDRPQAVVLPGIFATFSVFIMYRFFRGISENVMEAARMDGAGEFQIFLRIGIPLGSPGILSALVFSFLDCFSMLEQPMTFLKTKSLWPLSLFLPEITSQNAGFSLCASLVTILPAMFVFLAGQDYLEQGIAMAGAKE